MRSRAPCVRAGPPLACSALSDPLHAYKGRAAAAAAAIEVGSILGELNGRIERSVVPNLFRHSNI